MRKIPNWHEHFFEIARVLAKRSKDESTNIGAVIVGPGKEIVATGYNSFPRGIEDDHKERQERPEKYFWFEHAERNAIYNAARTGASLQGATLYVPAIPCMDCARGIVQVGIKKVIIRAEDQIKWMAKPQWDKNSKWTDHNKRTTTLFDEADVGLFVLDKWDEGDTDTDPCILPYWQWKTSNEICN